MKNILIVLPNLNQLGGTERAAISLANLLHNCYNITLLSLVDRTNDLSFPLSRKVNLVYGTIGQSHGNPFKKFSWAVKCRGLIQNLVKKDQIDIVIGLTHNINCVLASLNTKNLKVIGCEHVSFNSIPLISKCIISRLYPQLDAIVILSSSAETTLKSINKNIFIIPNSLPFNSLETSKLDSKKIIMVGRLSKEKGYERIVPLAKYLQKTFAEWEIIIFGEGRLEKKIKESLSKERIMNVQLKGTTKQIMDEYLKSSIFLSTSHSEAFPMVFLEAMSCGLPIISFKNEGARALINDNKNGFIVNSTDELIERTRQLIEDPSLRHTLGLEGHTISTFYNSETIRNKWVNLIENL